MEYVGITVQSEDLISLNVNHQIGQYLRNLFRLEFGIKLQRPSRSEHVMITFPGEKATYKEEILSFSLDSPVFTNGNAFWVDVISNDIKNYRSSLGLLDPPRNIHFCIGYLSNGRF